MSRATYNALIDARSDPSARRTLDDYTDEQGYRHARLGVALWIADAAVDAADDAVDAAVDAAAAVDDAVDAAAAAADAVDDVDADDDAVAAVAVVDADGRNIRRSLHNLLTKEIDMRNGLRLIQVPGRYGYSVTLVGWVERVLGDEFLLHNAVTVARTGGYRLDGLQKLASDGPGKRGYDVTEPAKQPEELHRLLVRRSLIADEKAWEKHCPKPDWWDKKVAA
jgi:hypothetical protein